LESGGASEMYAKYAISIAFGVAHVSGLCNKPVTV
jgi:hypothetical protein